MRQVPRLTAPGAAHTLTAVFRVLAAVLALAMLSTSWAAALRHVHAYVGHDHADHHHGPAWHGHPAVAHAPAPDSHASHEAARLENCDAAEHAVAVIFTYVAPYLEHLPSSVAPATMLVAPPEQPWRHVAPSDVRAHSPPRLTDAPLRAPPVVHLA